MSPFVMGLLVKEMVALDVGTVAKDYKRLARAFSLVVKSASFMGISVWETVALDFHTVGQIA